MDDQKDKLPAPEPDPPESEKAETPAPGIPEEADELIEIVDDEAPKPTPTRSAAPPDANEALRQLKSLRAKLDRKDKQIEQVMEAYRSKKAETEKLRKRIEKTERRRFEQSKGDFIARFVEVLDNLDRAIDSIENAFDPDAVLQGIMLVRSRLVQLLKEEGLEKIFVRGQPFDPTHSEAALMEAVEDESQDGVVLKELQPGYMLKGSLLRAARVVVGSHAGSEGAEEIASAEPPGDSGEPASDHEAPSPAQTREPRTRNDSEDAWETDVSGHELEFSEDGLDFSSND